MATSSTMRLISNYRLSGRAVNKLPVLSTGDPGKAAMCRAAQLWRYAGSLSPCTSLATLDRLYLV
jgi:hypothetical protein